MDNNYFKINRQSVSFTHTDCGVIYSINDSDGLSVSNKEWEEFLSSTYDLIDDWSKSYIDKILDEEAAGLDDEELTEFNSISYYEHALLKYQWLKGHNVRIKRGHSQVALYKGLEFDVKDNRFYATDKSKFEVVIPDNAVSTQLELLKAQYPEKEFEIALLDLRGVDEVTYELNYSEFYKFLHDFRDFNNGLALTDEEILKVKGNVQVMFELLYGFYDEEKKKCFYLFNSSAAKIRSGGQFFVIGWKSSDMINNPMEDWKFIEEVIRPHLFGLTRDEYVSYLKHNSNKPELKIETGLALTLSATLDTNALAKQHSGIDNLFGDVELFVADDVEVEIEDRCLRPIYNNPENLGLDFEIN